MAADLENMANGTLEMGDFFMNTSNRMPYCRSIVGKHHHPSSSSLLVTCSQIHGDIIIYIQYNTYIYICNI